MILCRGAMIYGADIELTMRGVELGQGDLARVSLHFERLARCGEHDACI